MVNVSLREAVKHFDVSRPTLMKALKTGKVTGTQDDSGRWTLDPSELARVYRPRGSEVDKPVNDHNDDLSIANTSLADEIHALRLQVAEADKRASIAEAERRAAEEIAEARGRHIEDLRRLLPAPNEATKPRQNLWSRIFGG